MHLNGAKLAVFLYHNVPKNQKHRNLEKPIWKYWCPLKSKNRWFDMLKYRCLVFLLADKSLSPISRTDAFPVKYLQTRNKSNFIYSEKTENGA